MEYPYRAYWGLTAFGMIEKLEKDYGGRPLFSWRQEGTVRRVTYQEFARDVFRLAAWFESLGLRGKIIVIDGRNTYEQITTLFAAASMGAVAAPLSFDLPLESLGDLLARIAPAALLYDEEDREILPQVTQGLKTRLIPCREGEGSIAAILGSGLPPLIQDGATSPDAPALLLATSGSTSRSKLVLLPHYGLLPHAIMESNRALFVLPMHHIASLCTLVYYLAVGIEVCLSTLGRGLSDFSWFRPTDIFAVPSFLAMAIRRHRAGKLDLSCLTSLSGGGAPENLEHASYLRSLGIFTMSLYGATETAGMVDYATPGCFRPGSLGKIGPWNQVVIAPDGEVLVKGKNVMLRYLDDPEATAQALRDGWYHTGDLGRVDEDGFLYIIGRKTNIIILSNGENVSPEAVEQNLEACKEIAEVVVRGEGDQLAAHIWCGEGAEEAERQRVRDFIARYNRTVPSYYAIRRILFRDDPFPKTASGKVKRGDIQP